MESDTTAYHLGELRVAADRDDPRRCVPHFDCTGWDVLDVGCGLGQTLVVPEIAGAASRHGIDVDARAIELGRTMFPELVLSVAPAERIPYEDARFDLVFSRVALPYTNVPRALAEMVRVIKPGGRIWLTLHSWRYERRRLRTALRQPAVRPLMDRSYVVMNSVILELTGRSFARPWSGTHESFQFASGMRRLLRGQGLADIEVVGGSHFCITARKAARQ